MTPKQPMIHSNPRLPLPKRIFAVVSMEKAEALAGGQQLQKSSTFDFWLIINHPTALMSTWGEGRLINKELRTAPVHIDTSRWKCKEQRGELVNIQLSWQLPPEHVLSPTLAQNPHFHTCIITHPWVHPCDHTQTRGRDDCIRTGGSRDRRPEPPQVMLTCAAAQTDQADQHGYRLMLIASGKCSWPYHWKAPLTRVDQWPCWPT